MGKILGPKAADANLRTNQAEKISTVFNFRQEILQVGLL